MTQRPDAPLGFCQSCGAKCLVSEQTHCASCGQKLIQLGERAAAGSAAESPTSAPAPAPGAGPAATTTATPATSQPPTPPAYPPGFPPSYPPGYPASYAAMTSSGRRSRRLLPLLIGVGLAAVLAVAGGLYVVTSSGSGAATNTSTPVGSAAASTSAAPTQVIPTAAPISTIGFDRPRQYRVTHVVTVTNGNLGLTKLQVYMARPIEWDGQKNITIEEVSPAPAGSGTDPVYGNGIYYWESLNGSPKPGHSMSFTVQFTFTAYETLTEVNPDKMQPYLQGSALYKLYTRSERYIESTDPKIMALADQLAGSETNPYLLARRFYDYVVATTRYKSAGKPGSGALSLLTNGEGDCGDYSSLFVALARAKGIPARHIVGSWAESGADQVHVWAEFYLEGLGWIPVDPTVGQSSNQPDLYFGRIGNDRVIMGKGLNFPLSPAAPGNAVADHLQTYYWWFWGTSGDPKSVSASRSWTVEPIG
jgi:transglutaminase-like putative cysteine protease